MHHMPNIVEVASQDLSPCPRPACPGVVQMITLSTRTDLRATGRVLRCSVSGLHVLPWTDPCELLIEESSPAVDQCTSKIAEQGGGDADTGCDGS